MKKNQLFKIINLLSTILLIIIISFLSFNNRLKFFIHPRSNILLWMFLAFLFLVLLVQIIKFKTIKFNYQPIVMVIVLLSFFFFDSSSVLITKSENKLEVLPKREIISRVEIEASDNQGIIHVFDDYFLKLFYKVNENPELYDSKKIKFKAKVYLPNYLAQQQFLAARVAMNCCAADTSAVGFISNLPENLNYKIKEGDWVEIVAVIKNKYAEVYKTIIPQIDILEISETTAPDEEIVYP